MKPRSGCHRTREAQVERSREAPADTHEDRYEEPMETTTDTTDTEHQATRPTIEQSWGVVLHDVLVFQFKLVVDGLKDLCLAQVALGAAVVDVLRRDGTPGHRFYGIVRLSDRFDRWIDLHEALERVPADAPDYAPGSAPSARSSVDDLIERMETSARALVATGPGGR